MLSYLHLQLILIIHSSQCNYFYNSHVFVIVETVYVRLATQLDRIH